MQAYDNNNKSHTRSVGVLTYYLLTGISPFFAETKHGTMENVAHATITYPDELFNNRSSESIDFIQRLLQRSPTKRMSAKECLSHPWITQSTNQPIIMKSPVDYQSLQTVQGNKDVNNQLKYAVELSYVDPIIEMAGEFLSPICSSQHTTQSPVQVVSYVNVVSEMTCCVSISPSLRLDDNYLPLPVNAISSINHHLSSSPTQSIRKRPVKLNIGQCDLRECLSEFAKVFCLMHPGNDSHRDDEMNKGSHLIDQHPIIDRHHDASGSPNIYCLLSMNDNLWNSNIVQDKSLRNNKSRDNYASNNVILSKYFQKYQFWLMFCDLVYCKLLNCAPKLFDHDHTTNKFGSSGSSSSKKKKSSVVTNHEFSPNKIDHHHNHQQQSNENSPNAQTVMNRIDAEEQSMNKISKYTIDIIPKMNGMISKTIVDPQVSTIRIELNSSSISGDFQLLNCFNDHANLNCMKDYLSGGYAWIKQQHPPSPYHHQHHHDYCYDRNVCDACDLSNSPTLITSSSLLLFPSHGHGHSDCENFHPVRLHNDDHSDDDAMIISTETIADIDYLKNTSSLNYQHPHQSPQHHHYQQQQQHTTMMEASSLHNNKCKCINSPPVSCIVHRDAQPVRVKLFTGLLNWIRLLFKNISQLSFSVLLPSLFRK
ncbi:unnamed protein product [Schistosoma turkestanicum]|nr:unnamed protein product [Schistosoma turkestanicum]